MNSSGMIVTTDSVQTPTIDRSSLRKETVSEAVIRFAGESQDGIQSIGGFCLDASGNIYVSGLARASVDGQPHVNRRDLCLTKYTPSGTRLWVRMRGSSGNDYGTGVCVDNVGNLAVFTIDTNSTVIGGGALVSFATKNDTAQAGAIMYSAGAFTAGDKSLDDNDTLTITLTLTVTAS